MSTLTYVETGVALAYDSGAAAWSFDLDHWGVCGQGPDEAAALADLAHATGQPVDDFTVVERLEGDERAFEADLRQAAEAERRRTQDILVDGVRVPFRYAIVNGGTTTPPRSRHPVCWAGCSGGAGHGR